MKESYIPLPKVQQIAGDKSRTTIWRWVRDGIFPKPRQIGPNSIAWLESELLEWVQSRKTT